MKSVGNIQKITAAMKMVAASRLKGAQTKMEKSRGLVEPMFRMLGDQPGKSPLTSSIFRSAIVYSCHTNRAEVASSIFDGEYLARDPCRRY